MKSLSNLGLAVLIHDVYERKKRVKSNGAGREEAVSIADLSCLVVRVCNFHVGKKSKKSCPLPGLNLYRSGIF